MALQGARRATEGAIASRPAARLVVLLLNRAEHHLDLPVSPSRRQCSPNHFANGLTRARAERGALLRIHSGQNLASKAADLLAPFGTGSRRLSGCKVLAAGLDLLGGAGSTPTPAPPQTAPPRPQAEGSFCGSDPYWIVTDVTKTRAPFALVPRDVDLAGGEVNVRRDKGAKQRLAVLSEPGLAPLELWMKVRAELGISTRQPLFCTVSAGANALAKAGRIMKPGASLSQPYIWTMLRRLADRAGIEKRVHPHGLRRRFHQNWAVLQRTLELTLVKGVSSPQAEPPFLRPRTGRGERTSGRTRRWRRPRPRDRYKYALFAVTSSKRRGGRT